MQWQHCWLKTHLPANAVYNLSFLWQETHYFDSGDDKLWKEIKIFYLNLSDVSFKNPHQFFIDFPFSLEIAFVSCSSSLTNKSLLTHKGTVAWNVQNYEMRIKSKQNINILAPQDQIIFSITFKICFSFLKVRTSGLIAKNTDSWECSTIS